MATLLKSAKLSDGSVLCWGNATMDIPAGSDHVRSVEFYAPLRLADSPTITATVTASPNAGTMFIPFQTTWDPTIVAPNTQVTVSAQNVQLGIPSAVGFVCHVVVVGRPFRATPLKKAKSRKAAVTKKSGTKNARA